MGKAAILLVTGYLTISGYTLNQMKESSTISVDTSISTYNKTVSHNCATSAVNVALSQLSNGQNVNIYSDLSALNGHASLDTVNFGGTFVEICGKGWVSDSDTVVVRTIVDMSGGYKPPNVRAAITVNAEVKTLGTLLVDGREHKLNGDLIPNSGTLAISTTETFEAGGNSHVAGTYAGADEGPMKFGYDNIVEEGAIWEDGYPLTPDLFMGGAEAGYPEGTLKQIAMSGRKGSQYVTDPDDLQFPLHGVTYVELPDGNTWEGIDFGNSSGILVVHNSSCNAELKNLNTGTFKGLIIADEVIHIHSTIIGALAALSPNPAAGNCIGNGTGDVLYSTKALKKAVKDGTGIRGDNLSLVSWYE